MPEAFNSLDSNVIIHQSRNIVKGYEGKISEDSQENSEQITLDSISENRATYSTNSVPTITCEWSESKVSAVFSEVLENCKMQQENTAFRRVKK